MRARASALRLQYPSAMRSETFAGQRSVLGWTSAAMLTLVPVAAFQLGAVRRLPDPPGAIFASERLTLSPMAHPLGIPDSLLGLTSYGVTLGLVVASRRADVRRLLAYKLAGDVAAATFNMVRQVVRFRSLCSWCTGTALCTLGMGYAGRHLLRRQLGRGAKQY